MAVSKLTERRLTKLIRFMRSLPKSAEGHFYMGSWFYHGGEHQHGLKTGRAVPAGIMEKCGTTACALGWACQIPAFRRAGLKIIYHPDWSEVRYKRSDDAGKRFFELSDDQATALFGMSYARTPKQWARRAAQYLKKWKKARAR